MTIVRGEKMEKLIHNGLEKLKTESLSECLFIDYTASNGKCIDSKFGGVPYFPKNADYPTNEKGYPLYFLAQINFEQMEQHELFPTKGMLQFFVDGNDELLGVNLENPTEAVNFRVIFHEDVDEQCHCELPYFGDFEGFDYIEIVDDYLMSFKRGKQYMSLEDYRFVSLFKHMTTYTLSQADAAIDDLYSKYLHEFSFYQDQILGYPVFLQADYRVSDDNLDVLLFQAVASEKLQFAWGDCGVLNFFISEEDLRNRDFSNVSFNFDVC